MRDSKGRFIQGHGVLPDRDLKTGKFIPKTMGAPDRYTEVRAEVDIFLRSLGEG